MSLFQIGIDIEKVLIVGKNVGDCVLKGYEDNRKYSKKQTKEILQKFWDLGLRTIPGGGAEVLNNDIDGVIATNTTTDHDFIIPKGGLSGEPLFKRSNEILVKCRNFLFEAFEPHFNRTLAAIVASSQFFYSSLAIILKQYHLLFFNW